MTSLAALIDTCSPKTPRSMIAWHRAKVCVISSRSIAQSSTTARSCVLGESRSSVGTRRASRSCIDSAVAQAAARRKRAYPTTRLASQPVLEVIATGNKNRIGSPVRLIRPLGYVLFGAVES